MPRTTFDPCRHGWPFRNTFVNHVGPFTTRGLCGGMALGAMDAFAAGVEIPRNLPLPPEGSPLYQYIFDRQMNSFALMGPDYIWQVAGTDSHHGRWSRGALNGQHFEGLRQSVDANMPVPIGLVHRYVGIPSGGDNNHHQVLGIGYDIVGPNRQDVRLHIYDPNYPDKVVILVPVEGSGPPRDQFGRSDYDRYVPTWNGTLNAIVPGDPFWGTYFTKAYTPQSVHGYTPLPSSGPRQVGWRWCQKCQSLFFSVNESICPARGTHDGRRSSRYALAINAPAHLGQHEWKWCQKCECLFYGGANGMPSRCPAGGQHDGRASGDYSLVMNSPADTGQHEWRWCQKCAALFFGGANQMPTACPAGGQHDGSASGEYSLVIC